MTNWTEETRTAKSIAMKKYWDSLTPEERNERKEKTRRSTGYYDTEHHQLESIEAKRNYMREYQRKFRAAHPDYYKKRSKERYKKLKENKEN